MSNDNKTLGKSPSYASRPDSALYTRNNMDVFIIPEELVVITPTPHNQLLSINVLAVRSGAAGSPGSLMTAAAPVPRDVLSIV